MISFTESGGQDQPQCGDRQSLSLLLGSQAAVVLLSEDSESQDLSHTEESGAAVTIYPPEESDSNVSSLKTIICVLRN